MDRESLARLLAESLKQHSTDETDVGAEYGLGEVTIWAPYVDLLAVADDVLAAMVAALPTARITPVDYVLGVGTWATDPDLPVVRSVEEA